MPLKEHRSPKNKRKDLKGGKRRGGCKKMVLKGLQKMIGGRALNKNTRETGG
jgi:hypothetical protein